MITLIIIICIVIALGEVLLAASPAVPKGWDCVETSCPGEIDHKEYSKGDVMPTESETVFIVWYDVEVNRLFASWQTGVITLEKYKDSMGQLDGQWKAYFGI